MRRCDFQYGQFWLLRVVFFALFFCNTLILRASDAVSQQPVITLASVDEYRPSARIIGGKMAEDKPGWFVELCNRAAQSCDAQIQYKFSPWSRVLKMVEFNQVSGAFHSSYNAKRSEYAVYPRKEGQLDVARFSKMYAYYIYVSDRFVDRIPTSVDDLQNHKIVIERTSAIAATLKDVPFIEVTDYLSMLRMVEAGHADMAIGIDHNLDAILKNNPDLSGKIKKANQPFQQKIGYVMFSKDYYNAHPDLVECFWSQLSTLRQTDWFEKMRSTYE